LSAGKRKHEVVEPEHKDCRVGGVLQHYDSKTDSAWRREATRGLDRAKHTFLNKYFAAAKKRNKH